MNEKSRTLALWVIALALFGHLIGYVVTNRYHYVYPPLTRVDNWTGEVQEINDKDGRWERSN